MLRQVATRPLGRLSHSRVLVVYNDDDIGGRATGEVVRRSLTAGRRDGHRGDGIEADFYRACKERMPHPDALRQKYVYLCDLPYEPEYAKAAEHVVWIAHHVGDDDEMYIPQNVTPLISVSNSPIELAWASLMRGRLPLALSLLSKYDCWDVKSDPLVMPFQYGMRARPNNPKSSVWDLVLGEDGARYVNMISQEGEIILAYEELRENRTMKKAAFGTRISGLRAIAANTWTTGRVTFSGVWDASMYDVMLAYQWLGSIRQWRVSVFTDKPFVDLTPVALQNGGIKHAHAVVFYCDRLPFETGYVTPGR